MIVVDHPCNVAELAHAVARRERLLDVLIDDGAGYIRIGVASATGVLDLAARIGEEPRGGACLMTANRSDLLFECGHWVSRFSICDMPWRRRTTAAFGKPPTL